MTHAFARPAVLLAAGLMASFLPSQTAAASRNSGSLSCIAPGAVSALPCGIVDRGTSLIVTTSVNARGRPLTLYFSEVTQSRKRRMTRITLPPAAQVAAGTYRLRVPPSLCAGRGGTRLFDVYQPLPGFNLRESIGVLSVAC